MPLPAYFLCSDSGARDEPTNAISCFRLLEQIKIRQSQPNQSGMVVFKPQTFWMVAVWIKHENDSPEEFYEGEIVAHFPPPGQAVILAKFERFNFTKRAHRLMVQVEMPGFPSYGIITIDCNIRPIGETQWTHTQTYRLILELDEPEITSPEQSSANGESKSSAQSQV